MRATPLPPLMLKVQKSLLDLSHYPIFRENSCSQLHHMSGAYTLSPKLGTFLLLKVCKSSSEIFNCNILNYANVEAMERRYALKNPTLCAADPNYVKYGLIGVCRYLQDEYSKLFKYGHWSALTDVQQSEGNNASFTTPTPSPTIVNQNGKQS